MTKLQKYKKLKKEKEALFESYEALTEKMYKDLIKAQEDAREAHNKLSLDDITSSSIYSKVKEWYKDKYKYKDIHSCIMKLKEINRDIKTAEVY